MSLLQKGETTGMTPTELLAYNGKGGQRGFEEYQKLLKRRRWIEGRLRGQWEALWRAEDSMSVFAEDEHDHPKFLQYMEDYQKHIAQIEDYKAMLRDTLNQLSRYMEEEA